MKPTLPPLPLVDGAFIIDNSGLERLKCPRLYQYSELQLRSPVAAKTAANFGSGLHRGLETRYQIVDVGEVTPAATVLIQSAMAKHFEENPQPQSDFRNFNHACKVMDVYNAIYRKEAFEIIHTHKPIIEATFCIELGKVQNIPVYYSGKIDLGIRDHNGIWSFDHKSTFQFGETFDRAMGMDGGQLGYCWALWKVLGIKPQGYIIDAIRIRKPKVGDEFAGIAPIDRTDFKRTPYYVTEQTIAEWVENVLNLVDDVFHYHDKGYFPMHRWNCVQKFGTCDYYDVCSCPSEQRETVLQSGLFEHNKWTSGLKTPETATQTQSSHDNGPQREGVPHQG